LPLIMIAQTTRLPGRHQPPTCAPYKT